MKRSILWAAAFITVGAVSLVLLLFTSSGDFLQSDPAKPRAFNGPYKAAVRPVSAHLLIGTNLLPDIQTSVTPSQADLDFTSRTFTNKWNWDVRVRPMKAGERVPLNDGSVQLELIGTAYGPYPVSPQNSSQQIRARFFHPNGTPLAADEEKQLLPDNWDRSIYCYGRGASVRFALRFPNQNTKFMNPQLFDARTGVQLTSGFSYGSDNRGRTRVDFETFMWHAAPVDFIFDIAHAPVQELFMSAKPGSIASFPGGLVKLLLAAPGYSSSTSTSNDGKKSHVHIDLDPARTNESMFVFAIAPGVSPVPLDLDFLDANDQILTGGGGSSSDQVQISAVRAPLSEVKQIRLRYYSQIDRFILRLPQIPGLPPQNQQVKNLFDVVIPFTVIQSADDLPERVRSIVQMQINSNRPFLATPPGLFPRTFTNTTPRQLLSEYLRLCPSDVRVSIKPQSDELEFRRPMLAVLIDKLRHLFRR